jgi:hypothetical protein
VEAAKKHLDDITDEVADLLAGHVRSPEERRLETKRDAPADQVESRDVRIKPKVETRDKAKSADTEIQKARIKEVDREQQIRDLAKRVRMGVLAATTAIMSIIGYMSQERVPEKSPDAISGPETSGAGKFAKPTAQERAPAPVSSAIPAPKFEEPVPPEIPLPSQAVPPPPAIDINHPRELEPHPVQALELDPQQAQIAAYLRPSPRLSDVRGTWVTQNLFEKVFNLSKAEAGFAKELVESYLQKGGFLEDVAGQPGATAKTIKEGVQLKFDKLFKAAFEDMKRGTENSYLTEKGKKKVLSAIERIHNVSLTM